MKLIRFRDIGWPPDDRPVKSDDGCFSVMVGLLALVLCVLLAVLPF